MEGEELCSTRSHLSSCFSPPVTQKVAISDEVSFNKRQRQSEAIITLAGCGMKIDLSKNMPMVILKYMHWASKWEKNDIIWKADYCRTLSGPAAGAIHANWNALGIGSSTVNDCWNINKNKTTRDKAQGKARCYSMALLSFILRSFLLHCYIQRSNFRIPRNSELILFSLIMSQSIPTRQLDTSPPDNPRGLAQKNLPGGSGFDFWKLPGGREFDKDRDFVKNENETSKNSVDQILSP